jgi:hypothetical protein
MTNPWAAYDAEGAFSLDSATAALVFGRSSVDVHAVRWMDAAVAYAMQYTKVRGAPEPPVPEQVWQPEGGEWCLETFVMVADSQLQYLNYKGPTAILLPEWVRRWARLGVLRRNCASELVLLPPWQSPAEPWFALGLTGAAGTRPHDRVEVMLPDTWQQVAFLWCASPMTARPWGNFMPPPEEIEDTSE